LDKIHYWHRIFQAYILGKRSHLSFWHGDPQINSLANITSQGPYYMSFKNKANYIGDKDLNGIPMLNYHGKIGLQYNPIAIAQWGLGNYNIWVEKKSISHFKKFISCADWLVNNLKKNDYGVNVWMHHFNFEYKKKLLSPWYSGLAQGLGLSVLVRAYNELDEDKYLVAHQKAWISMLKKIEEGGVIFIDGKRNYWIEEYILNPPTHIVNGFIWALWGVYDTWLHFKTDDSRELFEKCVRTLEANIERYDNGYWSLYDLSNLSMQNVASPFYHKLHIVQLKILSKISGNIIFEKYAEHWENYQSSKLNRSRALLSKSIFKISYF
tara:strand:- start:2892 stop:3863 length:972 start_codon:yes stop_codon:yes gene_type:complete